MADDASVSELAEDLRRAISYFVRSTRAQTDELTRSRAETLLQLERDGPQTIKQLAGRLAVRHQAMSRTVRELEELAFVEREPSMLDGRAYVIRLSDVGHRALLRDRFARRDLIAESIAARLTEDERAVLARVPALLRKLGQ